MIHSPADLLSKDLDGNGKHPPSSLRSHEDTLGQFSRPTTSSPGLDDHATPPPPPGLIPASIACHYNIAPLDQQNGCQRVAIPDNAGVALLDELRWILGAEIEPVATPVERIEELQRDIYGLGADTVERLLEHRSQDSLSALATELASDIDQDGEDASIIGFVNQLLVQAFRDRATDIHIEPFESTIRIRSRVDGLLYEIPVPPTLRRLHTAIVSRIKIMANLNIAEQRLPQDGRIKVQTAGEELDLRVSLLPTPFGESLNIRILNSNQVTLGLENLGLLPRSLECIEGFLKQPHGIILVTGPTGSGKTTTLYSCLNRLNSAERKIITVEDPIEYQLPGISQIQVNPKIGLTFAAGLRSMLRHDPDVMLVGEIRDHETAGVTIQVAMTGHLVFSTLHTNDAASAVARLAHMGIEPYLVAASVVGIVAQRLVRVICSHCRAEQTSPAPNGGPRRRKRRYGTAATPARGCDHCRHTGYFGRTALHEFLVVDDEIRDHIVKLAPTAKLREVARAGGMVGMREDGMEKVAQGITSVEEVLRVTQEAGS